ncbi:MAG TPA: hypothetical protein VEW69_06115 [Alphaproteobacteria bacterium]|nr:hypothetical protein [Alphaproteobacteria bacterium]
MKKSLFLAVAAILLTGVALAGNRHGTLSVNTTDDSASDDCRDRLQVYGDLYRTTARDEATISVPNQSLHISAERNGGIHVTTWDKPEFSIKLCKQAMADDEATARKALAETKLERDGSNIYVSSPDHSDDFALGVVILVKAPKDAVLSLAVRNGGVSLNRFTGTVAATSVNGGISMKHSSGKIEAHAQNGGISVTDCGGDVTANVQNGGITLALADRWEGKGLEAHTQNGGMVVSVPSNFSSGLEVSGSLHTSFACRGNVCDNAQRTWDDNHKIVRIGSNPIVHATTVNGGIIIQDRGHVRAEM